VTDFEISTDQARLDLDVIHRYLASSYWASGRTREVIERSIRHSLCFGAYTDGGQVAFARVITDRAVFGYLADVFVVPEYRGRGISKVLVGHIVEHPDLAGLSVFMLRTRDAQGLYARFGFEPLRHPEEVMAK
jgi:GNAT superfamily N-acetyltransferase